jgi:membrane protein DedA with SNARE-associated domain
MGAHLFELLRMHFQHHGYLTVATALLLENAGVPVPGETILLFASFLASRRHMDLGAVIVVATVACTLGDNLGYAIGAYGGRPLLERWKGFFHIKDAHIRRGEGLFERFGPATIFFARFIFGMRVVAGPLAGVLRMPWRAFALFNFLGAVTWVTVIALVGYLSGRHWHTLVHFMSRMNAVIIAMLAAGALFLWWRHRRSRRDEGVECERAAESANGSARNGRG